MRSSIVAILIFFSTVLVAHAQSTQSVTVFLAGDSTCAIKQPDKRPETGWGEMLGKYFKVDTVNIDNRALNGRSTKSFIAEGHWQKIVDDLKKGDYVFIQFGHNDESKSKGERYAPPEDFRRNLTRFVSDVRSKGGNPVLLTPVSRRSFKDGKFYDSHGEYPDLVRDVAKEQKVPLIDMHQKTETLLTKLGPDDSRKLFLQLKPGENANYPNGVEDNTHFNPTGAREMARFVVQGIRESKIGLRKYLK
jgi:lysophospholipase L1-like esterase